MKKIIRLTESDLTRIVKRVIEEQATSTTVDNLKKKFGTDSKFCFTDQDLKREMGLQGLGHINFYKVKSGDTYGGLLQKTEQKDSLKTMNPKCDLRNNLQAGTVIMMSNLPSR